MNDKNEDNLNVNDYGSMNSDKINTIGNNKINYKNLLIIGKNIYFYCIFNYLNPFIITFIRK